MLMPTSSFLPVPPWLGLYPVVDSVQWIARLLPLGVKTLQLRMKDAVDPSADIVQAIQLARQYDACLFINDYWELAIKHGAYGVHLGQEDIETADLVKIHRTGLRLGLSTHCPAEVDKILSIKPSYIALGHVFPTKTKVMPSVPQGVEALREQVRYLKGVPTVAIGGITLANIDAVLATGVSGVAVVSAITAAADWEAATRQLQQKCEEGRQ